MTVAAAVPDVDYQLGPTVSDLIGDLLNKIDAKRTRNRERASYYDMRNLLDDLKIAIPPHLRNLNVAMGWPAKAVDELSRRVRMEAFVLPDADVADFGVPELWAANRMVTEAPQAHTSALIHSVAFILTTQGDPGLGEPETMLSVHDALHATGVWDPSRRALSAALVIMSEDDFGPDRLLFLTPAAAADLRRTRSSEWDVRVVRHNLGRVPLEPLVYRPRIGRPFGSSRISRSVMSLTDSAMRTIARAEVGAEFYSAPQRYLLGASEELFEDPDGNKRSTWDLVMGRILSTPLEADENGDQLPNPEVGQFPQISMQPHNEQLRMWATMFAGETRLPLSSLGIVQDNPSSAEAIYAAEKDLVIEAEGAADEFTHAWTRSVATAVQLRDGLDVLPAELSGLDVRWRDPSLPSRAAATDSVMKLVSAGVLPADSPVTLEQLGMDETTVQRVTADRRRSAGRQAITALAQRGVSAQPAAEVNGGDEG